MLPLPGACSSAHVGAANDLGVACEKRMAVELVSRPLPAINVPSSPIKSPPTPSRRTDLGCTGGAADSREA